MFSSSLSKGGLKSSLSKVIGSCHKRKNIVNLGHFRTSIFKIFFNHGEDIDINEDFCQPYTLTKISEDFYRIFEGDQINFRSGFEEGYIFKGGEKDFQLQEGGFFIKGETQF